MQEITVHRTTDGKVFEDVSEAQNHQRYLDFEAQATKYLSTCDLKPSSATRAKNNILGFLEWQHNNNQ